MDVTITNPHILLLAFGLGIGVGFGLIYAIVKSL